MPTVLITGGTGMIGRALTKALLEKGWSVIVLTRGFRDAGYEMRDEIKLHTSRDPNPGSVRYAHWNLKAKTIDGAAIATIDHIIHLTGASVAEKRWTKKRKQEIVDSRVESGKLIVESLRNIPNQVRTVTSISGIGYYGPGEKGSGFIETDTAFNDFLAHTCREWEEVLVPVTGLGKRLVIYRTGIVLSKEGGVLKEFLKPLKFSLATILGSGKQIISWIHIDDLVRLFVLSIENENVNGVYNAVAPNPVSNKEFVKQLAQIKRRFFLPVHVPSFALKLFLGEMSIEVLKSAKVSSRKIQDAGFTFNHPDIQSALNSIIKKDPGSRPG